MSDCKTQEKRATIIVMYRKIKDKHKHTHSRYASKNRNKRVSHNNDIGCETFCDEVKKMKSLFMKIKNYFKEN